MKNRLEKTLAAVSMVTAIGGGAAAPSAYSAKRTAPANKHEVCTTSDVPNGTRKVCQEFLGKNLVEKVIKTDQEFITETATERTDRIKDTVSVIKYAFRHGHPYIKFESTNVNNSSTVTELKSSTPSSNNCQTASYTAEAIHYDQGNLFYDPEYTLTVNADWCYNNGHITSDTIGYSTNIPAEDDFKAVESVTTNSDTTGLDISLMGTFDTQNEDSGAYMGHTVGLSGQLNNNGTSTFETTSANGG